MLALSENMNSTGLSVETALPVITGCGSRVSRAAAAAVVLPLRVTSMRLWANARRAAWL